MILHRSVKGDENGFTLIELLVVILIIGVLAAIAIPFFLNQRKAAVEATMDSDLRNAARTISMKMLAGEAPRQLPDDVVTSGENTLNLSDAPDLVKYTNVPGVSGLASIDVTQKPDGETGLRTNDGNVYPYGLLALGNNTAADPTSTKIALVSLRPQDAKDTTAPDGTTYKRYTTNAGFGNSSAGFQVKYTCSGNIFWSTLVFENWSTQQAATVPLATEYSNFYTVETAPGVTRPRMSYAQTGCNANTMESIEIVPHPASVQANGETHEYRVDHLEITGGMAIYRKSNPAGATCIGVVNPIMDYAKRYDFATQKITRGEC